MTDQQVWHERINRAKKFREDDFENPFQVKKGRLWFEGKQNPGVPDGEWITVNKIYSHLLSELPFLYSIDPYFYVKLNRSFNPDPATIVQYESSGKIRQSYLNYLKGEVKLKEKARLSILDAEFEYGVAKVHFSAERKKNPDKGKSIYGEDKEPLKDDDGNELQEPDTIPVNERYHVTRVHPKHLLWDEDAGPLEEDWTWIAHRTYVMCEDAEDDPSLDKKALKTAQKMRRERDEKKKDPSPATKKTDGTRDGEVYEIYEIYELKKRRFLKYATGAKELVMEPKALPKGVDRHPFCILRFTIRDESPYPIPPVSQALDLQREINEARSKVLVHRKRFNRKYEVNVSLLENEDQLDRLESGEDGTIIRTLGRAVDPIRDAPLDQQNYQELGALNNDVFEMMGRSGESVGLSSADSATQAALIDKRVEIREGDKLSMVTDWLIEIGRKLDGLVQANVTRDEAVRIAGPSGEFWEFVKARDYAEIDGEYEYSVNVGSTLPRIPQIERQQWLAFLQVLSGFPQLLTSKRFMKHMAEMHHIEDESLIDELYQLGQQMMQAQAQPTGSAPPPGSGDTNPIAGAMGAGMGDMTGGGTNASV